MNLSLAHLWFKFIHQNYLIYNMCWEDVQIDRTLLKLDSDSKVMMITSAGCNALSYLLDQPKLIDTVDINPRQTALLDLKIQMLKSEEFDSFHDFFWKGKSDHFSEVYNRLKEGLYEESRAFWDDHIHYFDPKGKGLFYQGGAGHFARFLNNIIDRKRQRSRINLLIKERNQSERETLFNEIEQDLWNGLDKFVWPSNAILSLAGIPSSQQSAIGDMNGFLKKVIKHVFVDQFAENNPYWGRYLSQLSIKPASNDIHHPSNYETLKKLVSRISYQTSSFNDFLDDSLEKYTHFVLLDHMDWMVTKNETELDRLWKLIEHKSEHGSKILFRTAFSDIDFLPKLALNHFEFVQIDKDWLQQNDRVGTYTGTYLGIKK